MISKSRIEAEAEAEGVDADELEAEVRAAEAEVPAPGKSDAASDATDGGSAVKAHGGRGYFGYEFEVLTVNEVRASLFLDPIEGGDVPVLEWRKKFGSSLPVATE